MAPARKKQRLADGAAVTVADSTVDEESAEASAPTPKPASKDVDQDQHKRSLFVRSLPAATTSESLTELFSESYPVKHAVAVKDPATKQCRGYGFVTFADVEDAQKAKKHFNGHLIDGKKLRVELAERRHREGEDAGADETKAKRQEEQKEAKQPPKLIVRNLPWTVKTSDQLTKLFQSYGKVKKAYLPKRSGGLLPGFGFVLMRGRKNAEKAIEGVNGKEIDGRTLAVDWSVDKETYQKNMQEDAPSEDKVPVIDEADEDDESDAGVNVEDMDADADEDMQSDEEDDGTDEHSEHSTDATTPDPDEKEIQEMNKQEDKSSTIFVRNLPFTCGDEDLEDHFSRFGSTRYARVVLDHQTGRPKGTCFVCFYEKDDADACLRAAPRAAPPSASQANSASILQNTSSDSSGQYTLDGRVLVLSRAVEKSEANRLNDEGAASRTRRDRDKRRLYLLSEGTIATNTKLWESLPPSEQTMREGSLKQRKTLIESNPSLNLSLTRLSIRNIPRSITSKDLKQLAREAVVGFATEVKEAKRQRLTREELERGLDEMTAADEARKAKGKGIVRQAKVVFEGEGGGKVDEGSGAGRSRGYGFVEYYTHRSALMGLRWLNGHSLGYQVKDTPSGKGAGKAGAREALQDRKKRLIVEFAIENAQVMHRRQELERKARDRSKAVQDGKVLAEAKGGMVDAAEAGKGGKKFNKADKTFKKKRVHEEKVVAEKVAAKKRKLGGHGGGADGATDGDGATEEDKLAKRNRIIGRKRQLRRAKVAGRR
ncbi:hypothetical protein B0A48_15209 [Cryoendolithus antarcticus]|uniref:RRM domain-containing protein n=1 Tax=Cryoendolithus antarcticus TaxID=1507870 RepID=A0A1V8SIE7_9PEZI|nr:hypothetical protein B0A48_15209 [Cryoendolithus antarcticus]